MNFKVWITIEGQENILAIVKDFSEQFMEQRGVEKTILKNAKKFVPLYSDSVASHGDKVTNANLVRMT